MDLVTIIKDFGFPIVTALGLLYVIYYVWKKITTEIESKLDSTFNTLVALIDRIRMLDNDIIRLQQKLDTAIDVKGIKNEEKSNSDVSTGSGSTRKTKKTGR